MSKTEQSTDTVLDLENLTLPVKRTDGETLEDRLTGNAYENILPARYLRRNQDGELVEEQEELFARVAKNIALAEAVYEAENQNTTIEVCPHQLKPDATESQREEWADEHFGDGTSLDDDVSIPLTEDNVKHFAYDTVVPDLSQDIRTKVEDVREEFEEMMSNLKWMPNSPTLMNAGDELQQLSACFVMSPDDDIEDIHEKAKKAAQVFQSGGGTGYAFSKLRPYGDAVGSTGGIASGPITFMRTYDQMCATIAQGGKRRGAQMGIMNVAHPDIPYFVHAKNKDVSLAETLLLNDPDDYTHNSFGEALEEARDLIVEDEEGNERVPKHLRNAAEGHLSNFNISVGVTDDFMDALQNGEEFTFTNPRTGEPHLATEHTKELWDWFDLGEYVEVGEPLSLPAEVLWERIIDGAHENGEPGVIYLDRANDEHSFDVSEEDNSEYKIFSTNPCGEQPLMEYEACNLGHINLSTAVSEESQIRDWRVFEEKHADDYDSLEDAVDGFLEDALAWDEFNYRIDWGTRFLENVVTMSDFPIEEIERTVANNRKIGLGVMGLAQMYIQLGVEYGSETANEIARQLMRHINHRSKQMSHELAEERGVFGNWEDSKFASPTDYPEWFEKMTGEDPEDYAEEGYKIRNHNTTTIAPTGTTSMLGNTTGGCEPIYNVAYYKNVSGDVQGDEMLVEFDDYFLRTLEANDIDVEAVKKEAQEQMSNNEFDGVEGLETVPDEIGELFVITSDLSGKEHAAVQCACQEGVDSAISKTCNFPNDASKEDMDEVYRYIYEHGGKGVTVYRDGTRSKQVLTTRADNKESAEDYDPVEDVKEMLESGELSPEDLGIEVADDSTDTGDSNTDLSTSEPRDSDVTPASEPRSRPSVVPGSTQKINTGYGGLFVTINEDQEGMFETFARIGKSGGYTESFTEGMARLISLCLRSGIPPKEVMEQLEGIRSPKVAWDEGEQIHSVPDAIATAMRRHQDGEFEDMQMKLDDAAQAESEDSDSDNAASTSGDTSGGSNELISSGESPECPDCGGLSLYYSEGCKTCESCGWSEC